MKPKYFPRIFLMLLLFFSYAYALPKNVIIIRHAEKVPHGDELNLKGFERAFSLGPYFSRNSLYNDPPIAHIFAAAIKKNSKRPVQTCTPIAHYFHLPLNANFNNHATDELAEEILTNPTYNDASILICWSHGHIRPIALALGAEDPGVWEEDTFDQVYKISFAPNQKPKLQKILQMLMFGDRR